MAQSYTEYNELTSLILKQAFLVHTGLGPGLLESAYKECLYYKLQQAGLQVEKEKPMPLVFEDVRLECGYRIDLLVNDAIVLELKAVEAFTDVHTAQLLTYMRLGKYKIGYLLNFNVTSMRNGIKRYVM
ncbi:GxxExxY protein [Arsenicibacter rosenii]|uniref:GxxExxY protein n=1 Tax=Arsenicibacter rosenii TaxID=1750698 RepID=A0A1S2VDY7_9BACT|nr:GxxExxY protein [Arsenicibacter rosenii]OIN56485.1 GxxExxY protein [Arsenicibacter rosenii]